MNKAKRANWLPVVAALIKRENKVLLGRRPPHKSLGGLWEFPGGKIELGESPEKALERELHEELGIDAEVGPLRLTTTHNYTDVGVLLIFFEINFWKGEPKPLYHSELKWFTKDEVSSIELPEANRLVLGRLLRFI